MILYILALFCLATAAKPTNKPTSQPGSYVVDGVEGLLYEFPEYEDPEIALLRLSAMGVMPVLTVLEMGKMAQDLAEEQDTMYYEDFKEIKKSLDDVIHGLELARSKLENESTDLLIDIENSVHKLMRLEHSLHTDVQAVNASIHEFLGSDRDEKDFKIGADVSSPTQIPVSTSESPDFQSTSYQKKIKTPFGDALLITETNKYEDEGKATLRKKWTLKSSIKM